jgi:catabolite regulation protein CreA
MTDSDADTSLSIIDNADVQTPTYNNYEASLDGFRDANLTATSVYNKFRDLFDTADVKYYLIKRVGKTHDAAFEEGDEVSIYGVKTDFPVDLVGDGEMVRLGARFLTTGEVKVNIAVAAGTAGLGPELRATVGTKMVSNAKIRVDWIDAADVTNEAAFLATPDKDILNGGINLSEAIAWDSYDLGATDSNKIDDRAIVDEGQNQTRGFAQFSGSLMFFRDADPAADSIYNDVYAAFKAATDGSRPQGYLVTRIGYGPSVAHASGQVVSVFKFIADAFADNTEGEDSVKYMVNFMPQGRLGVHVTSAA